MKQSKEAVIKKNLLNSNYNSETQDFDAGKGTLLNSVKVISVFISFEIRCLGDETFSTRFLNFEKFWVLVS